MAQDEEKLYEYEVSDSIYCWTCHCYFASPDDGRGERIRKWEEHRLEPTHQRGGFSGGGST